MNRGECNLPGLQGDGWVHNWSVIDRVTIFINNEEVERINYTNDPVSRVQWHEERVEEADIDYPEPLKWARKRIDRDWPTNNENFEALLDESKQYIIKYSMEKNAPKLQQGAKFPGGNPGYTKKGNVFKDEVTKIIYDIGMKSTYWQVICEIERLAELGHQVWNHVDPVEKRIYYNVPEKRGELHSISYGHIKNQLTEIKKEMKNRKS